MQNDEFLSLNEVAKRLDLNYRRAMALRDSGVLVPDCLGPNNLALFKASRLGELRATKNFGLAKAIAHRTAQLQKTGR